jgi:hypothetical protein
VALPRDRCSVNAPTKATNGRLLESVRRREEVMQVCWTRCGACSTMRVPATRPGRPVLRCGTLKARGQALRPRQDQRGVAGLGRAEDQWTTWNWQGGQALPRSAGLGTYLVTDRQGELAGPATVAALGGDFSVTSIAAPRRPLGAPAGSDSVLCPILPDADVLGFNSLVFVCNRSQASAPRSRSRCSRRSSLPISRAPLRCATRRRWPARR